MLPASLLDRQQWLVWRFEKDPKHPEKKKLLKVPYYVDRGRRFGEQGSEKDRRRLAVHGAVVKVAPKEGKEVGDGGIGFAFLPGDGLIGIDLDNVVDDDGVISERAEAIINRCASYTEFSPSGRGVHIYVAGESEINKCDGIGVELFCGSQYFTVTGRHYPGTPTEVTEMSSETLAWLHAMINDAKEAARKARASGQRKPRAAPTAAGDRKDNGDFARVNDAAMANLAAWVPALLPAARTYLAGYRVSSQDLGRDLEEDLSILPTGIVDWGVNDLGDPREGRRTPIDLVIEWSSAKKPAEALRWLADRLGIDVGQSRTARRSQQEGKPESPPPDDLPPGGADPGDGGDDRPLIRWKAGELPEVVDQAEAALLESGLRIYQRAGFLVRVVRRDTPSVRYYKRRAPGALGIVNVDSAYLVEAMTKAAIWQKWNAKAKNPDPDKPPGWWVRCNAPEQAAHTLLARRGHWKLPVLWSAISTPTLRPDGTVLQTPGYDADMHAWYDPGGIKYPAIKEHPNLDDANDALEKLKEAFDSFPFESDVDRSVALALSLTALVRRSLPAAPIGVISAPVMESGKTLLADCFSILGVGVSAPAMAYADTEEEFNKTMLAVLADGDQVVLIDNVDRPLEGATLCAVLTSEAFRQRVLGRTEMMSVPTTTLFLATGNHVVVAGDLRTRTLLCRIDPKVEHPGQRQFEGEKRVWMSEHRPELVAAGLTIMRAFIATGQRAPSYCKTWGRFERWSDMVRAPLLWLGCKDPCASLEHLEKEDPHRIELARVLLAWRDMFGDDPKPAREAISEAMKSISDKEKALNLALLDVCKARDGSLDSRRLGHWLGKQVGRIVDGLTFSKVGDKDHTMLYKVTTVNTS